MATKQVNFMMADRKRNLKAFGFVPVNYDVSWIENVVDDAVNTATVSYTATPIFEVTNGTLQHIQLTGNVTSSSITYLGSASGAPDGTRLTLRIAQDATGGRTFVLPTNLRKEASYEIDTTANYCTVLELQYISSSAKWEFVAPPVVFPLN